MQLQPTRVEETDLLQTITHPVNQFCATCVETGKVVERSMYA